MRRSVDMLGFKIEEDPTDSCVTGYAGLLPYMAAWRRLGMPGKVDDLVGICGSQGWLSRQIVESIVLLNLAGGDCVTDIEKLEGDAGLCRMIRQVEYSGMSRAAQKAAASRFRAGRKRTFPAPTQVSAFLEECHDADEELKRIPKHALIPQSNEHLRSLYDLNKGLVHEAQRLRACKEATLDCDATLVESAARTALFCYKGFSGYQPYNVYWAEQDLVLHSEFRDGNVPASYDILRVVKEAVAMLPPGVERVYMRQDTAADQTDIMAWCERAKEHPEYGRILFTISADINPQFRLDVSHVDKWTPEYRIKGDKQEPTGREWAEVVYVPNSHAVLTGIPEPFRYIAIRERLSSQLSLLDVGEGQTGEAAPGGSGKPPFPVMIMDNVCYKLHAIATNRREEDAQMLIQWHYKRCGKSEEVHSVMKGDFAGGQLPSAKFGANAAWWALMILSLNFNAIMKRSILGGKWANKRMKAVRFELIASPARIVHHARQAFMRMSKHLQQWLFEIHEALAHLQPAPA